MIFVVDPVRRPEVKRALQKEQVQPTTVQFTEGGASAWRVR